MLTPRPPQARPPGAPPRILARAAAGTGAAAVHRRGSAVARAALALGVLAAGAAGTVLAGAGPAAAAPAVLYAAAAGTGDCSTAANACTLTTALGNVAPGGTIELVTPGGTAHYVGNWTVSTNFSSDTAPVTIEPAPGVSNPTLDGNGSGTETCSTTSCAGPVLTVQANQFVALSGITIANGNNSTTQTGGGLDNAGTVTITGSTFTGNTISTHAGEGAAIDNGDGNSSYGAPGTGTVTVTNSTFTDNTATNASTGGAISSGARGGGGMVQVTGSTFTGNLAIVGGVIDSGDGGGGSVQVTASTFTGNTAGFGGAIASGDGGGGGSVQVTASTFTGNTAFDGGAIDSGNESGSGGSVQVTASTFSGNTADLSLSGVPGSLGSPDGGAIDSGDHGGGGTVQVTASTFSGNAATGDGNTIDSGDNNNGSAVVGGTVQVAGDLFDGSCAQAPGTWTDVGYNAGTGNSCLTSGAPHDVSNPAVGSDLQTTLTDNGGPTQTIAPTAGNPAITLITNPATVTLGSSQLTLCPAADQRGDTSATGAACDAGAVQTTGSAATTTTTTTLSAPHTGTTGTAIPLTATLAGTAGPGGTITFTMFGPQSSPPADCTSGGTTVGTPVTVTGDAGYNPSPPFTPTSAGTYWWYASYSGASGNSPSASSCGTGMPSTTVTVPAAADLSLGNSGSPDPVVSGQPLTYTLTATNTGGQDATGVTVTDPLPAAAVFGSISASQGHCTRTVSDPNKNKDGTVTCSLGTVTSTVPATVTITVTPTRPGTLTGTATATASNVSPADGDDSAPVTVPVQGA